MTVGQDLEGDQADGDHELGERREVVPALARHVADEEAVDAQQEAAQHQQHGADEQLRGAAARLLGRQQDQRHDEAGHLDPEPEGLPGGGEGRAERAAQEQVGDAHDHVGGEQPEHDLRQRRQHRRFQLALEAGRGQRRLEDHHGEAEQDGRHQVDHRQQHAGLPERMDLLAEDHQQRAQRGLVHRGQQHAQRDEEEQHLVQLLPDVLHAPLLEEGRRELDPHHDDVGRDADRHLEHHRVHLGVAGPEDVPEVPPAAEVEDHRGAGQGVAEQAGQQRRPHQRVVLPLVEDVDQQRHGVAAAGEGRADHHVVGDPDAPGIAVVEVGHRAEAVEQAVEQDDAGDPGQHAEQQREGREQAAAERARRVCVRMISHSGLPPRLRA